MAFFGRFFGRAGSEAAGIALGATAVPALLPAAQYIVNEAWSLHPDRPPDVYVIAAGVAHEINQPVATIRAYADNSAVYLKRQQTEPVAENLALIAGLTERIGTISRRSMATPLISRRTS